MHSTEHAYHQLPQFHCSPRHRHCFGLRAVAPQCMSTEQSCMQRSWTPFCLRDKASSSCNCWRGVSFATRDNTPETIPAGTSACFCRVKRPQLFGALCCRPLLVVVPEHTRISLRSGVYMGCALECGAPSFCIICTFGFELHTALRAACCRDLYLPCLVSGVSGAACLTGLTRQSVASGKGCAGARRTLLPVQRQQVCWAVTLAAIAPASRSCSSVGVWMSVAVLSCRQVCVTYLLWRTAGQRHNRSRLLFGCHTGVSGIPGTPCASLRLHCSLSGCRKHICFPCTSSHTVCSAHALLGQALVSCLSRPPITLRGFVDSSLRRLPMFGCSFLLACGRALRLLKASACLQCCTARASHTFASDTCATTFLAQAFLTASDRSSQWQLLTFVAAALRMMQLLWRARGPSDSVSNACHCGTSVCLQSQCRQRPGGCKVGFAPALRWQRVLHCRGRRVGCTIPVLCSSCRVGCRGQLTA